MSSQTVVISIVAATLAGAAVFGAYEVGMRRGMENVPAAAATPADRGTHDAQNESAANRKVLYWHDPMHPGQKFDKPGKSPFMDMDLVPVYAEAAADATNVMISPRMQQNLGVRTAEVTRGTQTQKFDAPGSIAYNERDVAVVTARVGGFVEKLYVRAPLDPVHKGQPLAEIYVPDWIATQEEYLSVRRMQGQGIEALLAAARQRMLLAGMNEEQVRAVESGAKLQPRFTLAAPLGGVVAELGVREGMTLMAGATLFRINGLGTVWIYAEIPESRAAQVRPGAGVEVRTPSLPGRLFRGKVAAILPEVNPATRTVKARVEVVNSGSMLVPGMFAAIDFAPSKEAEVLLVPAEAVIHTGARKVVIVARDGGAFEPVDVETGAEESGQVVVRKGLAAGEKVVVSGQFMIDSEASLKATTTRMNETPAAPGSAMKKPAAP
jgi:Cu(I)/Ag(I) efflux system membrane fusion protein